MTHPAISTPIVGFFLFCGSSLGQQVFSSGHSDDDERCISREVGTSTTKPKLKNVCSNPDVLAESGKRRKRAAQQLKRIVRQRRLARLTVTNKKKKTESVTKRSNRSSRRSRMQVARKKFKIKGELARNTSRAK